MAREKAPNVNQLAVEVPAITLARRGVPDGLLLCAVVLLPAVVRQRVLTRPVPPMTIPGLLLLAAAIVLLAATLADTDRPAVAVVWGGVGLAVWCGGLLCLTSGPLYGDLGLARWKIGPWMLAWCAVSSGLATVTWSQPQAGSAMQITLPAVLDALLLVAVGMTAWVTGYQTGPGRLAGGLAARGMRCLTARFTGQVRSPAAPWLLYATGTTARLAVTMSTGRFGYTGDAASGVAGASGYSQILSSLSHLATIGVAAAALQVFGERRRGALVTLTVLFAAEIAAGAVAGNKQNFVITVLAVAVPFSASRGKLPKAAVIAAAVVFLAVIVPFNQAYRHVARSGPVTLTPSQAAAAAPGVLSGAGGGLGAVSGSVTYLLHRVREIDSPAIIMQRTPQQVPYASPLQLVIAPLATLIPRALWPGKPLLTAGYHFSQDYYGTSARAYSTAAITPAGDLYRHGGWVPLLAGMFLFGCLVRLLDDSADIRCSPHAVFAVLLLWPLVVKGEQDWVTLTAGIPAAIVTLVLAVVLAFRPVRSGRPGTR